METNIELFATFAMDRAISICEKNNIEYPSPIVSAFINSDKLRLDSIQSYMIYLAGDYQ